MYKNILKDQVRDAMYDINAGTGFAAGYTVAERKEFLSEAAETMVRLDSAVTFHLGRVPKDSWFLRDFILSTDNVDKEGIDIVNKLFNPAAHLKLPFEHILIEYYTDTHDMLPSKDKVKSEAKLEMIKQELVSRGLRNVLQHVYATVKNGELIVIPFTAGIFSNGTDFRIPTKTEATYLPYHLKLPQHDEVQYGVPANLADWWNKVGGSPAVVSDMFYCTVLLKFLDLLRCKNIAIDEICNKEPTKKQKRRMEGNKRTLPEATYRTLSMTLPGQKKTATTTGLSRPGLSVAVDVRAGHFKTFTKERPLFGKVTGTFWWQPILKTRADVEYTIDHQNI